jgi:type IV secretion system protein VirB8
MADIELLFPNMPMPRVSEHRETLALRRENQVDHWIEHNIEIERRGRKTAWVVAIILIIVCAAQAAAIAIMLPLKEVVPYTVLVDRQTGYVETARGIDLGTLKEDQAIVESMLAQYILARETFDPADFAERYDRVALWSLGAARDGYVAQYQAGAQSVLADMRPGTLVKVIVKNIEITGKDTAKVRFETQRKDVNADPVRYDWSAVVTYRFTGQPMKQEDRLLNPLGFQVTGYRRDNEVPGDVALTPVPQSGGNGPVVPQPEFEGPLADVPAEVPTETSLAQPPANGVDTTKTAKGAAQ